MFRRPREMIGSILEAPAFSRATELLPPLASGLAITLAISLAIVRESLGVYLFAGAFCYPAADSRPAYAVQNAPLSAQAKGDWPGSKSTGGTDNMLSILWTILIGPPGEIRQRSAAVTFAMERLPPQ